jgi:hypothetical protein
MRCILEDRPPEKRSGGEVADVLEVKKRVVLQRGVVEGGQVPQEVGRKPEPEGDGWAGEQPDRRDPADRDGECGWNSENEQGRRPLGQDHVLEQVGREQVVGQRVDRRDRSGEEEQAAGCEGGDAPPFCVPAADGNAVGESERDYWERRLEMERPGVGIGSSDSATLGSYARA